MLYLVLIKFKENYEGKKKEKKSKKKKIFKINKLFLYITSNLFYLFFLLYIEIKDMLGSQNISKKEKNVKKIFFLVFGCSMKYIYNKKNKIKK